LKLENMFINAGQFQNAKFDKKRILNAHKIREKKKIMKKLDIGVIGVGGRGWLARNAHLPSEGYRLVAGADGHDMLLEKPFAVSEKECGSPTILSKCCHDMYLLTWFKSGIRPVKVSSMGGRHYFCSEKAPAGAGKQCVADCSIEKDRQLKSKLLTVQ
jgi:hypothetical protein